MRQLSKTKAFSLIEVLIATVILSIGLLNIALLQQKTIQLARDAENYSIAVMLAEDMANRIQANYQDALQYGVVSRYAYSRSSVNDTYTAFAVVDANDTQKCTNILNPLLLQQSLCYSNVGGCTPAILAAADLFDWKAEIRSSLPNGVGRVCWANTAPESNSVITCDDIIQYSTTELLYTVKVGWTDTSGNKRVFTTMALISKPL